MNRIPDIAHATGLNPGMIQELLQINFQWACDPSVWIPNHGGEICKLLERWETFFTCAEVRVFFGLSQEMVFSLYLSGYLNARFDQLNGTGKWLFDRRRVNRLLDRLTDSVVVLDDIEGLVSFDEAVNYVKVNGISANKFVADLINQGVVGYYSTSQYGRQFDPSYGQFFNSPILVNKVVFTQEGLDRYVQNNLWRKIDWVSLIEKQ